MAGITFSEGSGLQDSVYGKCQTPIRMFMEKRAEAFEQMSVLPEIFNMGTSQNFAETYTSMTAMEGFKPVGENGAHPVDGNREGYRKIIEHETWKNSFSISREIIDDAKLMDLKKKPEAFISGYYRTRELFGAAMLGNAMLGQTKANFGGKSFDATTADGQALFSTGHTSITGGANQSNCFADEFSNDALMAVESEMQGFKDDNGNILDVAPTTILIPNDYELKKNVFAAIGADKDPATANNGFNYNFGRWNVIVWPYLNKYVAEGTKPWMLLDKTYNDTYDGAVWLDRVKLEVTSRIADNDANQWLGYARFGVGFNDWRGFAIGGVSGGTQLIS